MKKIITLLMAIGACLLLKAQETKKEPIPKKKYFTTSVEGKNAPEIDGMLDDPVWENVEWSGDYTQRRPFENRPPTQETKFKILYDAKNLYIAARCYDTEPDKIVKRMSRRDGFEGDWVEFNIDSYQDKRTAFSFTISVSGVKGDEFISNNGNNWDSSWDPIWYADTNIDDEGWTAEMRIPLSQLRYGDQEEQIWGLQSTRRDFREESRSVWQFLPQNSATWVSEFGELHGIKGIKPQKQIELQPYVVAQTQSFEKEPGNPFRTGTDSKINAGLNGKFGVTSDLVLDFTINPDFGQVEADPGAIALDGFEIFFNERRPFFIENRNLFDFYVTRAEAGGHFTQDNLFYSRRIGGSPKGYPNTGSGEYVNRPNATAILGAAKFSGKTKSGMGIGILESITAQEVAHIDNNGEQREEVVEPLTNYFVGRITQDYRGGGTVVGGMFTATNRDLKDTGMDWLNRSAYSGAVNFIHRWKNQEWFISGTTAFSRINGSEEAILNAQLSQRRSFNRPEQNYLSVDSTRTNMTGTGGTFKIGKFGGGNRSFTFDAGLTWRSPEFELNDLGFMRNSDDIVHFFWGAYRINKPFSIWRRIQFNYNHWQVMDFGGNFNTTAYNVNTNMTFMNNSGFGTGMWFSPYLVVNTGLRGGPAFRLANATNNWIWYGSDGRKKFRFNVNMNQNIGFNGAQRRNGFNLGLRYRPTNSFEFSIRPSYSRNKLALLHIANIEGNDGEMRFLGGKILQKTFSTSIRANWNLMPNLTIQYYGEPFISKGNYSEFKKVIDAKAPHFHDRYEFLNATYDSEYDEYRVDDNGDRAVDFTFGNPDFNFMQFRSNLVLRWEYVPGSELYLVWSQGTTNSDDPNNPLFESLSDNLFSNKLENIFLLKATYRFLR